MTATQTLDDYGVLIEPATLKIQRILPGPIERIWGYLIDSDLRRQWLAAGEMDAKAGAPFELVWRNDHLTDPPGARPDGFSGEHRMAGQIVEADPPHKLVISWSDTGDVSFELQTMGDRVLLTLIHHRILKRSTLLGVSAGWHAHLDVLAAKVRGERPEPFWDAWLRLKADYDPRIPAA